MKKVIILNWILKIFIAILILAIGLGLLAFSDVIKKGNIIESENNLTI